MKIGEVADSSGFSTSSIRYYETVGVLPAPERVAGRRDYDDDVLPKLAAIDVAQRAGLSLEEIRLLLRATEDERVAPQLQELARRKLDDVEALIRNAEAMRDWLRAAELCECATLDICTLFDPVEGARRLPSEPPGKPLVS